ncbi:MAG: TetR family transcriptional regulator [Mycobacteriaceae bacterium]|nr:TetR family transcriptional regulator [Mycobacteriaceae bacterium]
MASAEVVDGDAARRPDRILDIVANILETEGYDAVQLREVARRSRTSLATIYKRYPTRDELIVAALQQWMEENRYAGSATETRGPDESVYANLMRVLQTILTPWERHPDMLKAYYRARSGPHGERLLRRGLDAVVPPAMKVLGGVDAAFVTDLDAILSNLVYGLLARFAADQIDMAEILPTLERAVFWLTAGYEGRAGS